MPSVHKEILSHPQAVEVEPQKYREDVIHDLKGDFNFSLFYLSPRLLSNQGDWSELADLLGLSHEMAHEYYERLIQAGLWKTSPEGGLQVVEDYLNFGEFKIAEYLTISMNVIARMSENGPCCYESLFVVTNDELRREFYGKVNRALREFVEKSAQAAPTTIVAWNHNGLDCLAHQKLPRS